MQPVGYLCSLVCWYDTETNFKDPKLVYLRSFETNQQQTYKNQVFMSDEWAVLRTLVYNNSPSSKQGPVGKPKPQCLGLPLCSVYKIR